MSCEQIGLGTKKINDIKVRVILPKTKNIEKRTKNSKMFSNCYCNVMSVAAKESGKSNVMGNIVERAASTKTKVMIFAGSIWTDKTFKEVGRNLVKRGIDVEAYDSIKTGEGGEVFKGFIKSLREKDKQRQEKNGGFFGGESGDESEDLDEEDGGEAKDQTGGSKDDEFGKGMFYFDEESEVAAKKKEIVKEKKNKKNKRGTKRYAKYIVVIDDLAGEIEHNKDLEYLYKAGRHWRIMTITNLQWAADTSAGSRRNQDYWILFKGLQKKSLETVKRDADVGLPIDDFIEVYNFATTGDYSFLYYDVKKGQFRKNFDTLIVLPGKKTAED